MPRSRIPHFSIRYTSPPAPTFSHSRLSPRLQTDLDFGNLPEITGASPSSPRGRDTESIEATNEEDGAPYSGSSEEETDTSSKYDRDIEEEEEEEPTYEEEEAAAFKVSEGGSHTPVDFALLGNRFPEQSIGNLLGRDFLTSNLISERTHNTISEDRTIESAWSQNRLKGVLPHLTRPSSDQLGESDPNNKHPVNNKDQRSRDQSPPDTSAFILDFSVLENPSMAGKRKSNVNHSSASEHGPSKRINQDSQADGPFDTKSPQTTSSATDSKAPIAYPDIDSLDTPVSISTTSFNKETTRLGSREQYKRLMDRMEALQQENALLKTWIDPDAIHQGQPFFQIVYRFVKDNKIFFKPPVWRRELSAEGTKYKIQGNALAMKEKEYLRRSNNLAFVVFKTYSPKDVDDSETADSEDKTPPPPEPLSESILFASGEMRRAVSNYLHRHKGFDQLFPSFDVTKEVSSPYLFWYCTRSAYNSTLAILPSHQSQLVRLFGEWINPTYDTEYARVRAQVDRGMVSCDTMKYLIRPGDPLVIQERGKLKACQATSWATEKTGHLGNSARVWVVNAWTYDFDGAFYHKATNLEIKLHAENSTAEVELSSLGVTPLEYASQEAREKLENRGKTYWACRKKNFVSYSGGDDIESINNSSERFMIDFPTYRQLHPPEKSTADPNRTEIPQERMNDDVPPSAPEIYLFPSHIVGFNLRRKKWVNLNVDLIKDVEWNKQAFQSLVVEEETKELVQALITNRLVAERGTDMIDDKGNGLTILLHGGPGTGKTFTAESVAELAEKPLYRVSCGDIGTQPEEVERYLESALHLGKVWDCVVLLDEADVFLQERTSLDLQRNALVTVFLRVLEYYDGILILTSNRVGMIDEAFKSRIQVSLHYPNLNRSQRHKIWWNLMNRLRKLEQPNIDFDDIGCYVSELAEQEMNGRQIRNAITTARQLAKFKRRDMSHADLKHVIDVGGRFERYLSGVKEGLSDDVIARESGLR